MAGDRAGDENLRALRGQLLADAAVQVQPHESPRRAAEICDVSDGLLAAVAPLVQMHGKTDPAQLMRNRTVVRVDTEPRASGFNTQRIPRRNSCRPAEISDDGRELLSRNEELAAVQGVGSRVDPRREFRVRLIDG